MKTLKAAGAEHRILDRWSNLFMEQMNISIRRNYLLSVIDTLMSTFNICAPLILLWIGTIQVINGGMEVGVMLALNALASAVLTPVSSLVMTGKQLQLVRSHLDRLADVVEAEPEQKSPICISTSKTLRRDLPPRGGVSVMMPIRLWYFRKSMCISNLDKVAIVGRTGSGKSTLGNYSRIVFFRRKGTIFYDGIPLHTLNYHEVRAQFWCGHAKA